MSKQKQGIEKGESELLKDIQKLASREYVYEDGWCGMVPFHRKLTELQSGPPVPFTELHRREQADVLDSFIHWENYPARNWNDHYKIADNIEAGKKPEQWLEGTGIGHAFELLVKGKTPPAPKECPEITWDDIRAALKIPEPVGKDPYEGKTLQEIMESDEPKAEKGRTQERGGREM